MEDKCLEAFEEADNQMNKEMRYYEQLENEKDDRPVKREDLLKRHREGYNFFKNQYKHDEKVQKNSYPNLIADM